MIQPVAEPAVFKAVLTSLDGLPEHPIQVL
jgi:hypothetical protein